MLLILLASYLPAGGMSDPFLIGASFWQRSPTRRSTCSCPR
jgi:hypothetical protein